MRPGVLGGLGWLLLLVGLYASTFGWISQRKAREIWRAATLPSGELDDSLACDLVADFVALNEYRRTVSCRKAELIETGEAARLSGVMVGWEDRTYCLAKTPSWQVLRSARGVPCFPTPPADRSAAIASERERVVIVAKELVRARLEGIRQAMTREVRPAKCASGTRGRSEVPLLEFELLQGGGGSDPWAFLSTPWLRDAVLKGDTDSFLTATEHWAKSRPWVAVVTSASRTAASVGFPISVWTRGQLTGSITIVDAAAGELLCEVPFSFQSSVELPPIARPQTRRRLEVTPLLDLPTSERVQADFAARYHSAVMQTVNEMSGYSVWPAIH